MRQYSDKEVLKMNGWMVGYKSYGNGKMVYSKIEVENRKAWLPMTGGVNASTIELKLSPIQKIKLLLK